MADEAGGGALRDATLLIRNDITYLAAQTRAEAALLYRRLACNDGDVMGQYNQFIMMFYQFYLAFKHNAFYCNKITDWKDKIVIYDGLFGRIADGARPANILEYFDAFFADVVRSGVYNLSATEYVDRMFMVPAAPKPVVSEAFAGTNFADRDLPPIDPKTGRARRYDARLADMSMENAAKDKQKMEDEQNAAKE